MSVSEPVHTTVLPSDVKVSIGAVNLTVKESPSTSEAIFPETTILFVVSSPGVAPVVSFNPSTRPSSETLAVASVTTGGILSVFPSIVIVRVVVLLSPSLSTIVYVNTSFNLSPSFKPNTLESLLSKS